MRFGFSPFFTVKKLVSSILVGLFSFTVENVAFASAPKCENIFRTVSAAEVSTTITALAKLKIALDEAQAMGQNNTIHRSLVTAFKNKEAEAMHTLDALTDMNKTQIRDAIRAEIQRLQGRNNELAEETQTRRVQQKEKVEKLLEDNFYREQIIFNELPRGRFTYNNNDRYDVDGFAMMATMMTQKMWAMILYQAGERDPKILAPSSVPHKQTVRIGNLNLWMSPDNPVDRFDQKMLNQFLLKLNELSLSSNPKDQAFLRSIIPDHQEYDIYNLPSNQQWEYMRTNMGQTYKKFFDRETDEELALYAWKRHEDSLEIRPVAMLQPRLINGKPFFDIEGNALEFTTTKDGNDQNIVRGLTQISSQTVMPISSAFPNVGFRLIRLRRPF
jgi:Uncharacterized conserved protein